MLFLFVLIFTVFGCATAGVGWRSHIEDLFHVTDTVVNAAIIDKSGEIWIKDNAFRASPKEIKKIVSYFNRPVEPSVAQNESFRLMGNQFEILYAGVGSLLSRYGDQSLFAVASRDVVVLVVYRNAGEKNIIVRNAVYQLAQYLKMIGY